MTEEALKELLEKVLSSEYKIMVLSVLEEGEYIRPVRVTEELSSIYKMDKDSLLPRIAWALKDLQEMGLVECLNPSAKKGKLYKLTELGAKVREKLAEKGIATVIEKMRLSSRSYVPEVSPYRTREEDTQEFLEMLWKPKDLEVLTSTSEVELTEKEGGLEIQVVRRHRLISRDPREYPIEYPIVLYSAKIDRAEGIEEVLENLKEFITSFVRKQGHPHSK